MIFPKEKSLLFLSALFGSTFTVVLAGSGALLEAVSLLSRAIVNSNQSPSAKSRPFSCFVKDSATSLLVVYVSVNVFPFT